MESRKAEEWASQLQCWSLQLINCFAFKPEFLPVICRRDFLSGLPGMWGGLVNETSPAGVGLLRTICHQKPGRPAVAECPGVVESLCNIARSSDDWQCMAVDCLIWLLQDTDTRFKVLDRAAVALLDLVDLPSLGEHKRVGELITSVLLQNYNPFPSAEVASKYSPATKSILDSLALFRKKMKWERNVPKEDLQIKQAAALVVKLEGNARFSSGDIQGAASKYSEALALCPLRAKKERVVLHSNRAQCHLMLRNPKDAISDTTRALCLHNPVNRHGKSLWRRAQAYEILGLAKESLLDAIMFINECSQAPEGDSELKQNRVPEYVEKLVKKQMQASWLFKPSLQKHGGIQYENDYADDFREEEDEEEDEDEGSEWETASDDDSEDDADDKKDHGAHEWDSKDDDRKIIRSKPSVVFKGLTLHDIIGSHNKNSK
ncbi:hypothetical protein R1flu_011296 [Riccia fluitans]|uniref:ARM repeat N-terminal plant domain-containing protein n=1 Tax=Riccia fluitans TaxID=41844 RepID=A0ABD1Z7E7_9MARC